jgi:hypothetical protein
MISQYPRGVITHSIGKEATPEAPRRRRSGRKAMMDWSASILYTGISLSIVGYRKPNEKEEEG